MVENRTQREGVYRWFSCLTSAQRAEFLCGLLDLCVPIELRFLGSCLEDIARKDYHSLRDAEIQANNPVDLSGLTNIIDEVVRSKLLVSLALMGSDNREAAGVLYRTLTHIDSVINNYGLGLNDWRTGEQFLLLFTMASNHPAFTFHQKQVLRRLLVQIQKSLQVSSERKATGVDPVATWYPHQQHHGPPQHQPVSSCLSTDPVCSPPLSCHCCLAHATCWHKSPTREAGAGSSSDGPADLTIQHVPPQLSVPMPSAGQSQSGTPTMNHQNQIGKVVLERVALRGATYKTDDAIDFIFETTWSDGFVSSVVRSNLELTELLLQLSKVFPDQQLEKTPPQSTDFDPRCLTSLPRHVLQHHIVQLFFTSTRPPSPKNLSTVPHPSSSLPRLLSSLPATPVDPSGPLTCCSNPCCTVQFHAANRAMYRVSSVQAVVSSHSSVLARSTLQFSCLPPIIPSPRLPDLPSPSPALPTLNSYLHLHQVPPHSQLLSFPQLGSHVTPPEQNGILDWLRKLRLHKYYPVFKQLTMEEFLALTEEDLNKYDLTQGAKKKLKTQLELQKSADREMKMDKRLCGSIARVPPCSHVGAATHSCAGGSFEESPDKDHPSVIVRGSSCSTVSHRPSAQVLQVQADPTPCAPFPVPHLCPPTTLSNHLCNLSPNPKPRSTPLCSKDRTKYLGLGLPKAPFSPGLAVGVRGENLPPFQDRSSQEPLLPPHLCRSPGGLMVDTSSAMTSTSNSLHQDSHPPLHFHLSSSSPPSPAIYYSPSPSSFSTLSSSAPSRSQTSSSIASVSETSYHQSGLNAPPNSGPAHSFSMCVCSSCGCQGNCGTFSTLPCYAVTASYIPPLSTGPSIFTLRPFFHLNRLSVSSSSAPATFSYQVMARPPFFSHGVASHEQQKGPGFYQGFQKRTGNNQSCYNCGSSRHCAEGCQEPAMDAQQGLFRLRFTTHSDSSNSAND